MQRLFHLTAVDGPVNRYAMSIVITAEAIRLLQEGEVVAIPTETVYGLAGRIDREDTLRKIFSVKGRPFFDPLIVHVADTKTARTLTTEWPAVFDTLTEAFWPGPLTLIAPKTEAVSSLITSGLPSVAVRCPRHPLAAEILAQAGTPLAAPSANMFGHTSPTSAAHVEKEFNGQVPIVDGGVCDVGVESTVLSARNSENIWRIEILRPGGVSRDEIAGALQKAGFKFEITRAQSQVSPGHLPHHYQPSSPVVIVKVQTDDQTLLKYVAQNSGQKFSHVNWLNLDHDPRQAARELYKAFREMSRDKNLIAIQFRGEYERAEWEAVWDRISRASSYTFRG